MKLVKLGRGRHMFGEVGGVGRCCLRLVEVGWEWMRLGEVKGG